MRSRWAWMVSVGALALVGLVLALLSRCSGAQRILPSSAARSSATPIHAPENPAVFPAAFGMVESSTQEQGALCEGEVRSTSTQQPVPSVELLFVGMHGAVTSVRTNHLGQFAFQPSSPGVFQLASMNAEGYFPFAPAWGQSPVSVGLAAGQHVRGWVLQLTPILNCQGKVVGPAGEPVQEATVEPVGILHDVASTPQESTTDAMGRFALRSSDHAVIQASHKDYATGRIMLHPATLSCGQLVVRMGKLGDARTSASISGRVVDDAQIPLPGALVVGRKQGAITDDPFGVAEAVADAEGKFALTGIASGTYRLSASMDGWATAHQGGVATGTDDAVLGLSRGGKLRGTVRDAQTHRPIPSFVVHAWLRPDSLQLERVGGRVVVDPDGRYEVSGLPTGVVFASVTAPGYAEADEKPVEISGADGVVAVADFGLSSGATLKGRVVDRKSRAGIEGVRVSIESRVARGSVGAFASTTVALTDPSGGFELPGLGSGSLSLVFASRSHHGRIVTGIEVVKGSDPAPVVVELTPVKEGEEPQLELAGVGIGMHPKGDALEIEEVYAGGAAEEAGIRVGYLVWEVNHVAVKQLGYMGTVGAIRGPEGTTVSLTIQAQDGWAGEVVLRRRIIRL